MIMKAMHMQQLALVCAIALATVGAAADQVQYPVALPGCNNTCGNVTIPYPFGTGSSSSNPDQNCFLENPFNLTCSDSTLILFEDVEVLNISLENHELETSFCVSSVCYDASGNQTIDPDEPYFWGISYTISSKNKFYSVGCDTFGYFNSFQDDGDSYSTGCLTICENGTDEVNSVSCSGIGCCQVDIPLGMNSFTISAYSFNSYKNVTKSFNRCSYAFIHKLNEHDIGYNLSADDVNGGLQFKTTPMLLDWVVGNEICEVARKSDSYACRNNSYCDDSDTSNGYRCLCKSGFEGNPYLPVGCQDINECDKSHQPRKHNCTKYQDCENTYGSFSCVCKKGYSMEGTDQCQKVQKEDALIKVVIVAGAGFIALLLGMSTIYLVYLKRKLIKLKEKFFKQNGDFILQQQLSVKKDSSQNRAQIFTAEELKKATKNYTESLIIGKGGYGTVFKGLLADNRIVAIKKSRLVDQSQIEQLINEVIVLSQINHRNVVKLLGCCLETEVPLLVYEFDNNGTLYYYIHNEPKANNVSWKTRLRIAADVAGALAYLHSAASIPIIHRDVKTANILLDQTYTAKVFDFGVSRLVPVDHVEIATMVQGIIGYLDLEYMQTSQLTKKSDMYSFGVVLVELLTGEKALSFDRPKEKRSLSMHFLSSFKESCLFEVLEKGIAEVMEVAVLASKCSRLMGEERPSMKEVAMELEGKRMMNKHPWGNSNIELNLEETEYLLHHKSGVYEYGCSSNHHNTRYDSIRDQVLIPLDDGR